MNLDPTIALVLLGVLKLEELGTALDVIKIAVGESDDIEVVAGCVFIANSSFLKLVDKVPRMLAAGGSANVVR